MHSRSRGQTLAMWGVASERSLIVFRKPGVCMTNMCVALQDFANHIITHARLNYDGPVEFPIGDGGGNVIH